MRLRLLFITVGISSLLWFLTTAVLAQGEPPSSYAGLKNPFLWSDTSVQEIGKKVYQQSCLGCHGIKGNNLATSDFSRTDFSQSLEERADFYFWVLSEGRLNKGMPPYKSSLSEEQRWQVLTYLWSFGAVVPSEATPPTKSLAEGERATLRLTAPQRAQSGQPLTLTAVLSNNGGKPIANVPVTFLIKVDFFASGLMEIGDAMTDDKGAAVFDYTPRQAGDTQVVARYQESNLSPVEAVTIVNLIESTEPFYQAEAGLRLPAPGEEIFIGPKSALDLGEWGKAPTSAFYLPGGILSWLLLIVVTVMLIWFTYFRVIYQVFRIPIVSEMRDIDTRLVPLAGLAIVLLLGVMLTLMILTGPYSHLHLLR